MHNKKAGFVLMNFYSSKLPIAKHGRLTRPNFHSLIRLKMRFMMWRHGAESCSITRFTIKP